MVEVKGRVTGGVEEVAAGVETESKVTAAVDTDLAGAGVTLHGELEGTDVGLGEEVGDIGPRVEVGGDVGIQVAFEAAWIVGPLGGTGGREWAADWTKVDGHVFEGATGYAAASSAGWNEEIRETISA